MINRDIMIDLKKECLRTWADLSGVSGLTKAQFEELADRTFAERIAGKYDNRVTVIHKTYFTPADDARGYSWSTDVTVYGDNMMTVGQYNITSRRRSELA